MGLLAEGQAEKFLKGLVGMKFKNRYRNADFEQ